METIQVGYRELGSGYFHQKKTELTKAKKPQIL